MMTQENDYALEIDLAVGADFTLTFNEQASAGYLWTIDANSEVFDIEESYAIEGEEDSIDPTFGSSLRKTFNVKAKKAGTYDVTFTHARPFDTSDKQEIKIKVNVEPS